MSIKLTLLKSGETLISETKELVSDEGQTAPHAYLLNHPHLVNVKEVKTSNQNQGDFGIDVTLTPWIILSADTEMVLPTDWVVTIVEPLPSVKQMYLDKKETFKIEEETDGN